MFDSISAFVRVIYLTAALDDPGSGTGLDSALDQGGWDLDQDSTGVVLEPLNGCDSNSSSLH